ncbi:unnamed protein product [Thelazia callipaeda]|uniref:PH domain-containing protein n=1 Tax=Thelazia callipaeda TaxID=103827 RepID=A0A0N5DBB2_THECL|nr:unnamed protein product [Thelazia callipaeda]
MIKGVASSEQSPSSDTSLIRTETTSSTFYAQTNNASTSVHVPSTTHRIQRFINFFSSNDQAKQRESAISSPIERFQSRHHQKGCAAGSVDRISKSSSSASVIPVRNVCKQGQLMHQASTTLLTEVAMGELLKNDRHKWKTYWAVLHGSNLYLCQQLNSYINDKTNEKLLNIPTDAIEIDLKLAIVDIAYEYWRRKNSSKSYVFRVITQQQTEHHFQVYCENDMLNWIETIRLTSCSPIRSRSDQATTTTADLVSNTKSSNSNASVKSTKSKSADSVRFLSILISHAI